MCVQAAGGCGRRLGECAATDDSACGVCSHPHYVGLLHAISLNLFNIFIILNLDPLFYYARLQFISFS